MKHLLLITLLLAISVNPALADEPAAEEEPASGATATAVPAEHPVALPEGLTVDLREIEAVECAYLEGTIYGDMEKLFGDLYSLATEQGLLTDGTMWGSAYPDDMSQGIDEGTRVFAGISVDPAAEVAEPLLRGTLPGGTYMTVQHWGDYEQLGDTYTAVFTWAAENGVTFGLPVFEHYVTDPETTPVEEWLTEIYLPFDHDAMQEAYAGEKPADTPEGP